VPPSPTNTPAVGLPVTGEMGFDLSLPWLIWGTLTLLGLGLIALGMYLARSEGE